MSGKNREVNRARFCLYSQTLGRQRGLRKGSDELKFLLSMGPVGGRKGDGLTDVSTEHQ